MNNQDVIEPIDPPWVADFRASLLSRAAARVVVDRPSSAASDELIVDGTTRVGGSFR